MGQIEQVVAPGGTVDLSQVTTFVQVVEAGSFTAAARALGLPKSSVSRAVAKLEQHLGVLLLQRTTRSLALTEAGRIYLARAREALQLLSDARHAVSESELEPRGVVRVTAASDPTGRFLAQPIARFLQKYPQIHVEVILTPRRVDLIEEGVDLAIRAGKVDDASLAGKRIDTVALRLYAAPSYLEARGTPRRLKDLAQHNCLLYRAVRGSQRWTLMGKAGPERVNVRGPVSADDLPLLLHFAIAGLGIALLPSTVADPALASGELVRVLPAYEQPGGAIHVLHPAGRHLPQRVRLLRDFLVQELRAEVQRCQRALKSA